MFKDYDRVFGYAGIETYSSKTFQRAIRTMATCARACLDREITCTMQHMQDHRKWRSAIIGGDGTWITPGATAPHGLYVVRALGFLGAVLGYKFMSRNDLRAPFMGTSASMEIF